MSNRDTQKPLCCEDCTQAYICLDGALTCGKGYLPDWGTGECNHYVPQKKKLSIWYYIGALAVGIVAVAIVAAWWIVYLVGMGD